MPRLPKLPQAPKLGDALSAIDTVGNLLDKGLDLVDKVGDHIDNAAEKLGGPVAGTPPPESPREDVESTTVPKGTACLPCCRDHLSVVSSALSEGMRFARDKGVRDPEALRRIRIALDELNAMERIDLAPDETARLQGAEKDLADWTLVHSRAIRHAITAISDPDTMEQAAAKASQTTEEFMSKLWDIPQEECETCGELGEKLTEFIEKRKRERG